MFKRIRTGFVNRPYVSTVKVVFLVLFAVAGVTQGLNFIESQDMSGTYVADGLTIRLDSERKAGLQEDGDLPEGFSGHMIVGGKVYDVVASSAARGQVEGRYFIGGTGHPFEISYPFDGERPAIALIRGGKEVALERIDNNPDYSGFDGTWRAGPAALSFTQGNVETGAIRSAIFKPGSGGKKVLHLSSSGNAVSGTAWSGGSAEPVSGAYNPNTRTLGLSIGDQAYEFSHDFSGGAEAAAPQPERDPWRRLEGKFKTADNAAYGVWVRLQFIDEWKDGIKTGEWTCEGEYVETEYDLVHPIIDCRLDGNDDFTLVLFINGMETALVRADNTDTGGIVIAWDGERFEDGFFFERVRKPLLKGVYASADGGMTVRLDKLAGDRWSGSLAIGDGPRMAFAGQFISDELRGVLRRPNGNMPIPFRMISSINSAVFESGPGYRGDQFHLKLVEASDSQPHVNAEDRRIVKDYGGW